MRVTIQPADEVQRLHARSTQALSAGVLELARAIVQKDDREAALAQLHKALVQRQAEADLLGRRRTLRYARAMRRASSFADDDGVPAVPFDDAIRDFISRTPELAQTAEEVLEVYARHGWTLIKAAEHETVDRVKRYIETVLKAGQTTTRAAEVIAGMGDWSRSYAETVHRNAISTAYSAGTFRQMQDPDVAAVIGGLMYRAVGDNDTRPNHLAAQGLIAAEDDPVWDTCAPPCGHRCRCGLRLVDWLECRQRGLVTKGGTLRRAQVPRGFFRDPGFGGGRPDRAIYG